MAAVQAFSLSELLNSALSLGFAFALGTLIGAERQYRQRTAGLRTNVLVSVGAAAFVDLGMRLAANPGAIQVTAYVVSGVGFIGAGVIMKEGMNVRGLNTAATLWCSAAVGACSGADLLGEATLLTGFVLAGNTLLRPVVNAINRTPIDERATEATYEIRLTTDAKHLEEARDLLTDQLEAAHYPVQEVAVRQRGDAQIELVATLVSTAVEPKEIEAVLGKLSQRSLVQHATWTVRTTE